MCHFKIRFSRRQGNSLKHYERVGKKRPRYKHSFPEAKIDLDLVFNVAFAHVSKSIWKKCDCNTLGVENFCIIIVHFLVIQSKQGLFR